MKNDFKNKDDAELIQIIDASPYESKITNPMRIAAKIELHEREKKGVKKISRMTLAILILTAILVLLTLLLVFLTEKAIPSIKSEVLQSNQINETLNYRNQAKP
jgi:ABC-type phosphate transport system permease subunit